MIPELRTAIYNYCTGGANPFITLLGAGNFKYKKVKNKKNFPYCIFEEANRTRSIDSGNKFVQGELHFRMYDGSNDGVKESSISAANIEATAEALDALLDLKENLITISNYLFVQLKQISINNAPTDSNSIHGAILKYKFILQIER